MINVKCEFTTTIIERNKYTDKFKAWFDAEFSILFPETAANFQWQNGEDDDGQTYAVDNLSAEEMTFYSLFKLYRTYKTKKREKQYFDVPGAKDFYSANNDKVELDADIAKTIKILNSKGYITVASCSGHESADGTVSDGYIWIKDFPAYIPKGFKKTINNDYGACMRWKAKTAKQLEIKLSTLEKWAKALPILSR